MQAVRNAALRRGLVKKANNVRCDATGAIDFDSNLQHILLEVVEFMTKASSDDGAGRIFRNKILVLNSNTIGRTLDADHIPRRTKLLVGPQSLVLNIAAGQAAPITGSTDANRPTFEVDKDRDSLARNFVAMIEELGTGVIKTLPAASPR